MPTVEETTTKVQRILASKFGGVKIEENGYSIDVGSTAVKIRINSWVEREDGQSTFVHVWAPVARDVAPTPDLFRWAATSQHVFGSVFVLEGESQCLVGFDHTILGDHLDPAELENSVALVALTADEMDDEVVARFGGKRYADA